MSEKIEITGPEAFIAFAARPLLDVIDELIKLPRSKKEAEKARALVEKAMWHIERAYEDVR